MTIQYKKAIRNNVPQLFKYTFTDQGNVIIPLDSYVSFSVQIKQQGQIYDQIVASPGVQSPPANGIVWSYYTFTSPGVWDVQFLCIDGSGNELFGEPIQVTVSGNVEDLALSQLPNY